MYKRCAWYQRMDFEKTIKHLFYLFQTNSYLFFVGHIFESMICNLQCLDVPMMCIPNVWSLDAFKYIGIHRGCLNR